MNLESLREFTTTERQAKVLDALIEAKGCRATASKILEKKGKRLAPTNISRFVMSWQKRAAAIGKGSHFIADNNIPSGYGVKGTTTLYKDSEPVMQWVRVDKDKENEIQAIEDAINNIIERVEGRAKPKQAPKIKLDDTATLYIANDVHFGALMWAEETRDRDYDLKIAYDTFDSATSYLTENSPASKVGIVVDLGDLTEADNFKNETPTNHHKLDVDSRYSKTLDIVYESYVNMIDKALDKHETVYFYNIPGNHDETTWLSIKSYVSAWYRNEPRLICDTSHAFQKYHLHGETLIGFAHGHGLKMRDAGEVMAMHNQDIFSNTTMRYYHFGHIHKDAICEGRLCKAEAHRNISPLNAWAANSGFGRQAGTMKSITYDKKMGEISRVTYNVLMG